MVDPYSDVMLIPLNSYIITFNNIYRHSDIVPKGQAFWDQSAINKFKELVAKCGEVGMIAVKRGVKCGPSGDMLCVVLIDTATNNLEDGIQIHSEMLKLGLAEWKDGNDSGYNSSPLNRRKMPGTSNHVISDQGKLKVNL